MKDCAKFTVELLACSPGSRLASVTLASGIFDLDSRKISYGRMTVVFIL